MRTALKRLAFATLTCIAALPMFVSRAAPREAPLTRETMASQRSYVVNVVTRDFRCHFRCVDPSGVQPEVSAGRIEELHLPAGAAVELRFTSEDYVYVCSIPELGVRQIAVPGLTHHAVCKVADPGEYDVIADPLCSVRLYHDELMGRIVVGARLRLLRPGGSA